MEQRYTECCNYTRLVGQWGRLRRRLFASRYPWCPPLHSLCSLRWQVPRVTQRAALRASTLLIPNSTRVIQHAALRASTTPHSTLLTSNSSLKKNAAEAIFSSADVIFRWSGGLLLVAVPPYGDGPNLIILIPAVLLAVLGHHGARNLGTDGLQVGSIVVVLV